MAMDAVRQCVLGCLPFPAVTKVGTLSAVDDYDGEDRISTLPDDLLRDVVSRLLEKLHRIHTHKATDAKHGKKKHRRITWSELIFSGLVIWNYIIIA
ncbi:hypothetical protein BAE44_0019293 [Dichanthelium oligosanthes]|uniref:Uncharacterized protein n=1 Tax=Dichanthelium oligosanthes TaxID=888268 RepID=A0A1E5V3N4_9POAL|nr:hypothetical protein BAE44_0019293 [Dichanthelium oligosanthes]